MLVVTVISVKLGVKVISMMMFHRITVQILHHPVMVFRASGNTAWGSIFSSICCTHWVAASSYMLRVLTSTIFSCRIPPHVYGTFRHTDSISYSIALVLLILFVTDAKIYVVVVIGNIFITVFLKLKLIVVKKYTLDAPFILVVLTPSPCITITTSTSWRIDFIFLPPLGITAP